MRDSNAPQVDPGAAARSAIDGAARLPAMSAPESVLRVALPVPLPRLFDYRPPATGTAVVGGRVRVPFGSRSLVGVVAAIGEPDPARR